MNQKKAKAEALKIAKEQSHALTKFVNDNDILLTINQGVLEIHAFHKDENGTKMYNHIVHKLPSRLKSKKMTLNQKANDKRAHIASLAQKGHPQI